MTRTAILVDGAFFIKRAVAIFGKLTASELANKLFYYSCKHLKLHNEIKNNKFRTRDELYRIFYYDCPPLNKRLQHPITKEHIDFSKSERAVWRNELFKELSHRRKVALRLGKMDDVNTSWTISPKLTNKLINGTINPEQLTEKDIKLVTKQKGVDMRIGIDIASLAYKGLVDRIVLIAGDSDFVPAAKLARREGIDFILDPMWAPIKPDLFEHIDGLKSTFPNPDKKNTTTTSEADENPATIPSYGDDFCD